MIVEPTQKELGDEHKNSTSEFYTLPIPECDIKIVSNVRDVEEFFYHIKAELNDAEVVVVGIDAEWKPVQSNCAALLQIAFKKHIFLVDLIALKSVEEIEPFPLQMLLNDFFANQVRFFFNISTHKLSSHPWLINNRFSFYAENYQNWL